MNRDSPSSSKSLARGNASRRAATLLAVMWLASGCAHNVLYDENRDKQGQGLKQAVAEARLAGAIASLEKTFAELAAREEDRARDRATHLFDLELQAVSRASSLTSRFTDAKDIDGLQTVVQARLARLGLKEATEDNLKQLRTLGVQMSIRMRALEKDLDEFRGTVGRRFESCLEIYAASANPEQKSEVPSEGFVASIPAQRRALVAGKFEALIRSCKRIDQVIDGRRKLLAEDGQIKKLIDHLDAIEREIVAYDVKERAAKDELDSAIKTFRESGVEAATKPAPSKLQSLEQRAEALRHAVHIIGEIDSAFGLAGAHVIAEAKLKNLETVLGAIAGSSGEGKVALRPDEQAAVAIVRDLPALADEADKLLKEAKKPRLVPFLAAIDQQKLVLQGFEAGQRAKRKQADAAHNQVEAALNEGTALAGVLRPLVKNPSWAARSISDLDKTLAGPEKREFYRALATYADEVQQFRIETAVWGARERAAQYEEGLVRSKFAAAQWDGLIDTMATVLADYHAAGIKQADLAEFFKALGLVVIGIGVAQ